jgi:hypothetical protein
MLCRAPTLCKLPTRNHESANEAATSSPPFAPSLYPAQSEELRGLHMTLQEQDSPIPQHSQDSPHECVIGFGLTIETEDVVLPGIFAICFKVRRSLKFRQGSYVQDRNDVESE